MKCTKCQDGISSAFTFQCAGALCARCSRAESIYPESFGAVGDSRVELIGWGSKSEVYAAIVCTVVIVSVAWFFLF